MTLYSGDQFYDDEVTSRLLTSAEGGGSGRGRTAIGAPSADAFDELFAYIDGLDQWELRRLTERLHRYLPPWAWRR